MMLPTTLTALLALLHSTVAAPNAANLEKRQQGIATRACNGDNLYNSFIDRRYSASASAFCSTYIRSTVTTAATATATITKRGLEQRDLAATTQYPASRLSSACSCILTAKPTPTTVYTTTQTITRTTTAATTTTTGACSVSTPIVKNGGFEAGQDPWTVLSVQPPNDEYYSQYESFGVKSPGYNSANAYTVTDNAASSYFELDLGQNLTLCAGQKYNFAARFYMTDSKNIPTKETYLTFFVDDVRLAGSTFADGIGPPIVWKSLSGSFTAKGAQALLKASFVATNIVGVTWGIDDVVVTPA
ncbi:MAG: hypothetical protein Q9168_005362 [Polycauliona sp. 1 TL-2023]